MVTREEKTNKKLEEEMETLRQEKKKSRIKKVLIIIGIILLLLGLLISYMRFIGTTGLQVREYAINNDKIPESFHGFKIVHFTDLHYKTTINKKELSNLVDKINELKPDIVVFTGDLVDKHVSLLAQDEIDLVSELNRISATTGLYTVKGNHDYYSDSFNKVFDQTNFKYLYNNYDLIYYKGTTPILITGINSDVENDMDIGKSFSFNEIDNLYTITLLHEPDSLDDILQSNNVDLALAGHSHNGQVRLPFIGAIARVSGGKKYANEYYKVNDTDLYISGGIGTSGYKLRFFDRPSINLYRLISKEKES